MLSGSFAIMQPLMQAGKIKVLAVTSRQRAPTAPEILTAAEVGYPDLTFESIGGIFGPRGISDSARAAIADGIRAVSADPVIKQRIGDIGTIMDIKGPKEFSASVKEQQDHLAAIARILGLKALQ